ncbi:hypothetical protein, partial [Coleofasciculus sp. G2-EDA-02]|uniref:hypothetical protein n=1 Tax=Coleofasciculus sp. G2-EDA-02 TaxID=3069529 RepID=UPI00330012F8
FCNRQEIGENPRYIKVERDCTHVGRLKNRAKPHGEAVLIFWLGELQLKAWSLLSGISCTQDRSLA